MLRKDLHASESSRILVENINSESKHADTTGTVQFEFPKLKCDLIENITKKKKTFILYN